MRLLNSLTTETCICFLKTASLCWDEGDPGSECRAPLLSPPSPRRGASSAATRRRFSSEVVGKKPRGGRRRRELGTLGQAQVREAGLRRGLPARCSRPHVGGSADSDARISRPGPRALPLPRPEPPRTRSVPPPGAGPGPRQGGGGAGPGGGGGAGSLPGPFLPAPPAGPRYL